MGAMGAIKILPACVGTMNSWLTASNKCVKREVCINMHMLERRAVVVGLTECLLHVKHLGFIRWTALL